MTLVDPLTPQTAVADRQPNFIPNTNSQTQPRRPGLVVAVWQRAAGIAGAVIIGPAAVLPQIALLALLTLAAVTVGLVLLVTGVRYRATSPTRAGAS